MGTVQSSNSIAFERPLLSQIAIATCLVGGAAALSSAGIAVPVTHVGFADGWDGAAQPAPASIASAPRAERAFEPAMPIRPDAGFASAKPAPLGKSVVRVTGPEAPTSLAKASARLELATSAMSRPEPVYGALPLVIPPEPPVLTVPVAAALPAQAAAGVAVPQLVEPVAAASPVGEAVQLTPSAQPALRLVDSPELRGFNLANVGLAQRSAAGLVRKAAKPAASSKIEVSGTKDKLVGEVLYHQVTLSVAGSDARPIDVRIGEDMKPSLKVGDLLGLVSDRMDPESAARFSAAASAGEYVSLATLRAAGFDVSYNAGSDSISISVPD